MFAERLKQALQERGISQTDLSRLTGLGKSSISQYVSGKNIPREPIVQKIADVCDCSADYLKGETENLDSTPLPDNLKNVPIETAAKILGKSKQFVRVALQKGTAPFGFAVKLTGGKFSYHISPKKLMEYVGREKFNQ
jgi:transcriptional regulator with XRE-family HTH domain